MLKKYIFSIIFLILGLSIFAQKPKVKNKPEYDDKPIHFGYTLGINVMDFTFDRAYFPSPTSFNSPDTIYADLGSKTLGFQVGMIADMRLGEYFNLRILPSFNFGQRNLIFTSNGKSQPPMKLESSMLDFPVLIKYKAKRINNYRPYLIGGGSVRYDLAAKKKFDDSQSIYVLLKPLDFYYEMGFGIDYYFPYFKFSTELKLSIGMLDVLNHKKSTQHPEYVASLRQLNSNIVMFSIHFE